MLVLKETSAFGNDKCGTDENSDGDLNCQS